MIAQIVTPVIAMAALGLIFGTGLACALKVFRIEVDPTVLEILSKLPGVNCGACGKPGCAGFAEALKKGEVIPSNCSVTNEEARESIAQILGIEYSPKVKTIATVLCNGGKNAKDKYIYKGIESCKADTLIFGGHKKCDFGCLGHGDCVKVCPSGAIKIAEQGIPEVSPERCTACGKCVEACPKSLISLTPVKNAYYVKCSSKDRGAVTAKICKGGCIACRKCEKACSISAIKVESNLSKIDYEKCQNMGKCFEVCPTEVIIRR